MSLFKKKESDVQVVRNMLPETPVPEYTKQAGKEAVREVEVNIDLVLINNKLNYLIAVSNELLKKANE